MPNLVGIFPTRDVAELAVQGLLATAISPQSITLLSGEAGKSQVASLTTTDAERDGMGEAVGHWHGCRRSARPLVIANVDDPDLASVAKAVFERQGSEDIDQAFRMIPPAA